MDLPARDDQIIGIDEWLPQSLSQQSADRRLAAAPIADQNHTHGGIIDKVASLSAFRANEDLFSRRDAEPQSKCEMHGYTILPFLFFTLRLCASARVNLF